jgi:hypothetical protein
VWVDESGGTDTSSTDGMTVHVDGEDYTAEVNYDVNHDGVNDTAIVEHDDGTAQVFTDTDHDGVADQYGVLDDHGKVVDTATYDQASGQWVEAGGHSGDRHGGDQQSGSGGTIHADMPKGDVAVGPPTIDTDHDGKNDTAVVQTKDGGTIAFTDKDGDGEADVAVETDASGHSTTYEHTGKGEWTERSSGLVADSGSPAPDSDAAWHGAGTDILAGVAKIDSVTGQWISPN